MIKDTDIDLTANHKFGNTIESTLRGRHLSVTRKLSRLSKEIVMPLLESFERKRTIPWLKKQMEMTTLDAKRIRSYDDALSDEAHITLRRTSNNTIMQIGDKFRYDEVMEEFFYETIGYLPWYSAIARCWECGHIHIRHSKTIAFSCSKCAHGYKNSLPWKRQ